MAEIIRNLSRHQIINWFQDQGKEVVTLLGNSEMGYQNREHFFMILDEILDSFDPQKTIINFGGPLSGSGEEFQLITKRGFMTTRIMSTKAAEAMNSPVFSVENIFVVNTQSSRGFLPGTTTPSPLTSAIISISQQMIAIGGNELARDELLAGKEAGVPITVIPIEMNHQQYRKYILKDGRMDSVWGAASRAFGLSSTIEAIIPKRNVPQRLVLWLAAIKPIAWFLARTIFAADRFLFRRSRGRFSLTGLLSGTPLVLLTTIGAKSGKPRTIPLLAVSFDEKKILFATTFGAEKHPAWYHNLLANPTCKLEYDGAEKTYIAREAIFLERPLYWALAVIVYPGYAQYRKRASNRKIPIMVLDPT